LFYKFCRKKAEAVQQEGYFGGEDKIPFLMFGSCRKNKKLRLVKSRTTLLIRGMKNKEGFRKEQ